MIVRTARFYIIMLQLRLISYDVKDHRGYYTRNTYYYSRKVFLDVTSSKKRRHYINAK